MTVQEAQGIAEGLLGDELPRRWKHVQGVAGRAVALTGGSSTFELVTAAAWLHDIGYASGLAETGFHPIDGGRFLRRQGVDERVVNLVAHHSCARIEANLRGLLPVIDLEFPRDNALPHDDLCFCDMTTSPDGESVAVGERLAEIRARYGPDHPVTRFVDAAEPTLTRIVRDVEARLEAQPR